MSEWVPVSFDRLAGWAEDDHLTALSCFRMSARGFRDGAVASRSGKKPSSTLLEIAARALDGPDRPTNDAARNFFETHFTPHAYRNPNGFVTGYFEPEVIASRQKTAELSYPLYAKPADLLRLDPAERPDNLDPTLEWARKTGQGYEPFPDRKAIDNGALAGQGLELFWVSSAVEAFYIHVQGSARLLLTDGQTTRISYAGKSGHPYTSIGRLLVKRGIMTVEEANMTNMRKWLDADQKRAMSLLHENRSYIFFSELKENDPDFGPVAAAGVQLTPGRSLAVDKAVHPYGTPVWIATNKPLPSQTNPFRRLMIAQDTGSAIVGLERGDLFIGSGDEAGAIAGSVRHSADFVVLIAKDVS